MLQEERAASPGSLPTLIGQTLRVGLVEETPMAMVLPLEQELQDDHRKARDGIFDLLRAIDAQEARRAREIIGFIDLASGPHWRWEEEALYPALRQFSEELVDGLMREHDDYIAAVEELARRFKKKSVWELLGVLLQGLLERSAKHAPGDEDLERARQLTRTLFYHLVTCDGLIMWTEILGEEKRTIREAIFVARRENVPLLEWSRRLRQR